MPRNLESGPLTISSIQATVALSESLRIERSNQPCGLYDTDLVQKPFGGYRKLTTPTLIYLRPTRYPITLSGVDAAPLMPLYSLGVNEDRRRCDGHPLPSSTDPSHCLDATNLHVTQVEVSMNVYLVIPLLIRITESSTCGIASGMPAAWSLIDRDSPPFSPCWPGELQDPD